MPDDGLRYALLDGTLLVRPAPGVWHQEVALELAIRLRAACLPELHVVIEWRGGRRTGSTSRLEVLRVTARGTHSGGIPSLFVLRISSPACAD